MNLNNKESKARKLAVFAIILDILTFTLGIGFIFIAIGHDANSLTECNSGNGLCPSSTVPLGQWKSFPLASQCSSGNYTASNCELIGNTTYRGIIAFVTQNSISGFRVGFTAGCTIPSNTVGAFIQLQYANYSTITRTNSSNFANIAGTIKIDNSANWPCPGNLFGGVGTTPPGQAGFVFRVVGSGGGGIGDNPRFSSVSAVFHQLVIGVPTFQSVSITTTGFSARVFTTYPVVSATTLGFSWIATNSSNTNPGCGTNATGGTFVCVQRGTGSCSVIAQAFGCVSATTFTTAFTGTVSVVGSGTNTALVSTAPIGGVDLLLAQTITV